MANVVQSETSCAVHLIGDLPDSGKLSFKEELLAIAANSENVVRETDNWNEKTDEYEPIVEVDEDEIPTFYLMVQAQSRRTRAKGWVERFAAYLQKEGLGSVCQSEPRINASSSNRVIVFTWAVNKPALAKWIEKNYDF